MRDRASCVIENFIIQIMLQRVGNLGYEIAHVSNVVRDEQLFWCDGPVNYTNIVLSRRLRSTLERICTVQPNVTIFPRLISDELCVPNTKEVLDDLNIYGGQHG